jgi:O-antigen/teichoic acid export membrane protein
MLASPQAHGSACTTVRTRFLAMSATLTETHDDAAAPRRVWSATLLQALGRAWSAACTLTVLYLTADALTLSGFGRFTFYLAVFAWLDSLANMGTGQVAVQWTAAARERTADVLATARRVRVGAGALGVLLVAASALAFDEPDAGWIVLAALYPVTHALELSTTVFHNRIAWGVPVAVRATASGLSLAGVALLAWRDETRPALYLVAVAAGSTVGNLLLHAAARGLLARDRGERPHPVALAPFLRAALPLGLAGLCAQTYFYVDNLFVRAWCGEEELGRYNLAVRFLSALIMLAQYASLSALPWFTRAHARGELGAALSRLAAPSFVLACFAVGTVWSLGDALLHLFGPQFAGAEGALRWLLAAVLAIHLGALALTAVVATGSVRAPLGIAAIGLLLNMLLNTLWVPRYGIDGAAAATFATEAWVAAGALSALRASRVGIARVFLSPRWLLAPVALGVGLALGGLGSFVVASLAGWG